MPTMQSLHARLELECCGEQVQHSVLAEQQLLQMDCLALATCFSLMSQKLTCEAPANVRLLQG